MQSLECRVQELESERKTLKRKVVECEEKLGEKEDVGTMEVNRVLKEETEKLLQNVSELSEENARLLEERDEDRRNLEDLKQQEGLLKAEVGKNRSLYNDQKSIAAEQSLKILELDCEVKLARHRIISGKKSEVEKRSEGLVKGYNEVVAQREKKIVSTSSVLNETDRDNVSNPGPSTNSMLGENNVMRRSRGGGNMQSRSSDNRGRHFPDRGNISNNERSVEMDGFTRVGKKARSQIVKSKVVIIGSSHAKHLDKVVRMDEEGSYRVSMAGAGIKDIIEKAEEANIEMEGEGTVFIVGGGNSIMKMIPEEIVKITMRGVKRMLEEKKANVCVLGILPRPREGREFERRRIYTNRRLKEEIIKIRQMTEEKNISPASFLDLDRVLSIDMFAEDGVHLNPAGTSRVGKEIVSVIRWKDRESKLARE